MRKLREKLMKNSDDIHSPEVRTAYGKLSSCVGIACNALLFLGKMLVGTIFGSVSITADAVNNLSDASSSVISLFGFKLANKPADAEHAYGHGRYEYLSGLMVAVLIMVIGVELLRSSFEKILAPSPVAFSWISIAVLSFSVLLKLWMAYFNRKIGKKIDSQTLIATAADSRNDVIATVAVLAASLISHFASVELDGWMGLAVAIFILYSGFGLIRETLNPLLGRAPDPKLVQYIQQKIMSYPDVLGTHDLMIHDYGPGRQFGSVHVEMAAEGDVLKNHDVIDNIERDFLNHDNLHMIVHFDPIATTNPERDEIHCILNELLKEINPQLTFHDLRIVPGPTHTNVIFDCVVPHELQRKISELKNEISRRMREKNSNYFCVITIDTNFAALPHTQDSESSS